MLKKKNNSALQNTNNKYYMLNPPHPSRNPHTQLQYFTRLLPQPTFLK